ncbi:hypothetical protein AAFF_G00182330 [Aldrovandia affinis]|uniref:Transmembrane protein n=1 Tax=Aldrovandia affinis TaxID=143900 RepID=A0AAD7RKA8_9TELE|nr:hypothetical protein AAFF_G00182330 [Aldrovandia affinis]
MGGPWWLVVVGRGETREEAQAVLAVSIGLVTVTCRLLLLSWTVGKLRTSMFATPKCQGPDKESLSESEINDKACSEDGPEERSQETMPPPDNVDVELAPSTNRQCMVLMNSSPPEAYPPPTTTTHPINSDL